MQIQRCGTVTTACASPWSVNTCAMDTGQDFKFKYSE
jgi:hypothetical protein